MNSKIIELKCPGCGARVSTDQKECEWCHQPIVISSISNIYELSNEQLRKYEDSYREVLKTNPQSAEALNTIAMCYLKQKNYDKAYNNFEKAIEEDFNNSDTYFFAAVSLLKGKKAYLSTRPTIDKIVELVDAANNIEEKGIYYLYLAYIKYDYFKRKCFNTSPDHGQCMDEARRLGYSDMDVERLFGLLGVAAPAALGV